MTRKRTVNYGDPSQYGPLTRAKVEEMGLAVDDRQCTVQHRPGMKPHRHIALPERKPESEFVTHACPECGDVHLPPRGPETA